MISISKRTAVLIISFTIAAIIVLGGFVAVLTNETAAYKYSIDIKYQHAFSELVFGMSEIDSALQKSLYATSPTMISAVNTDVFGKAMMTQMALGQLPFYDYQLANTTGFISKVGDYSYMLSRNASMGTGYSSQEKDNLKKLSDIAALLSQTLLTVENEINKGAITISELKNSQEVIDETNAEVTTTLGESFKLIESEFPEVPALIYDGPFSQHITNRSPKYLEGLEDIDSEKALSAAAEFLGREESIFESESECRGALPHYCLSASTEGGEASVAVTKKGGKILSYRNSRSVGDAKLSENEAIKKAADFLSGRGYPSMKESYYVKSNNTLTINFAYVQDGAVCYPDLIKVAVALDNGSIVGFESAGFIMNHTKRQIPPAVVNREIAQAKVSPELKVLAHSMAIIPTMGQNEVYCHEFKCENGDAKHYIIYVNAETGNEEKIVILLEDENGTLAM